MAIGDPSGSTVLINNLNVGNPLHIQTNDNSSTALNPFKLLDTENYRIWASAMKLTLKARNKFSFVDGTCLKSSYNTSDVLSTQWDRCNAIVLTWIMTSVSQDAYMGLVYSNNANKFGKSFKALMIRPFNNNTKGYSSNNNVNRGPNPNLNCKNYHKIGHTTDRCYEIVGFPPGFKRNANIGKQSFNANTDVKVNDKQSSSSLSFIFTSEQIQKMLKLINDK
nr:putative Gag-polypeptide of LTR copia-type [Tanacetum cinerariifolium]